MKKAMIAVIVVCGAVILWSASAFAAETALTSSAFHHEEVAWSPDGQWIVYRRVDGSGINQIWKVSVTGGSETQLTTSAFHKYNPTWAPNNSAIAYERIDADGYRRIYKVSPSGGAEALITTDPGHYQGFNPNWSPDSSMLTLWVNKLVGPPWVCTVPATGGNYNWLVQPGSDPVYSHSGDKIAYGCPNINGYTQICTIPSGGGASTQLTSGDDYSRRYFKWSQNDEKIVYWKNVSGYQRIYIVPSTGGSEILLTPTNDQYGSPYFSPNDLYILFQKGVGITWQIYYMFFDGSNQTPITNDSYNNIQPRWSPDGTKILYLKTDATGFRQAYISDFVPPPGPIPTLSPIILFVMGIFLLTFVIIRARGGRSRVREISTC